ncbi:hypothetical protein ACGFYV_10410 [Streptomyces sp. NPDC048297]|uniref:hypothetical protein n=1 Tax=Streptomyces sp. NPDC048297 TaxID=3365531 RepID=UPI00370F7BF7
MSPHLPPVAPAVTAELVEALSPRLRKRLDAGIAKLADNPATVDGTTVRIAIDDTTHVELHAPDGTVTTADDIRCGCLLAPSCLHRAAAASAAPVADVTGESATDEPAPDSSSDASRVTTTPDSPPPPPDARQPTNASEPAPTATTEQRAAARSLLTAAGAVLEAGTDGSGAVLQAELLRAAHTAGLAGLPRAASSAVSAVTALRAARASAPTYRLADLATALGDVLTVAHRAPHAEGAELTELRGTARQPYRPDGSLRLYGVFSEPVLTASGYAGAVTWTADAGGRLYQVSDVAPGGAGRAVGAADRAVRIGDTALTHRELSRAGLAVSGATVSPTGRLGAGARVRAVRASGADWRAEPLDRLWAVPVCEQVSRALTGGPDLLFLDVVLTSTVREAAGDCLLADCGGVDLRLRAAHDHPALPHRENLRLLAAAQGSRLRIVARLTPAPHPRATLLAIEHPTIPGTRVDVGLDHLRRADLPTTRTSPPLPAPLPDEPPLHLLRRRVHQAVSGGRRALSFPADTTSDTRRLNRHGLSTAGDILGELHAAATERSRDVFGRLLPTDADRFTRAWLTAARYTDELDRALCAAAWAPA